MSRSYRKTPIYTVRASRGGAKYYKKLANRKVRRVKFLSGKSKLYRKIYETWDIVDYRFYEKKPLSSDEKWLKIWRKCYYQK